MNIIEDINDMKLNNTAITIGNFDGVHVGHQKLIRHMNYIASKENLQKVIFTFKDHTSNVLEGSKAPCLLASHEEKIEILKSLKPDYIVEIDFTKDISRMSYMDFIKNVLLEKLGCKVLIIGQDFKMGYNGLGNIPNIASACSMYEIELIVVPHSKLYGNTVSSTYIRKLISEGKVDIAADYLGRYYSLTGSVIHGKQLGRTIGFPTVNLNYMRNLCLPKRGVYVTYTMIYGKWWLGITNIGTNPTVKKDNNVTIESYLIGFDGDLYGKTLKTAFVKYIRDEKQFANLEELRQQLFSDVKYAINYNKLFYNHYVLW